MPGLTRYAPPAGSPPAVAVTLPGNHDSLVGRGRVSLLEPLANARGSGIGVKAQRELGLQPAVGRGRP